MTKPIVAALVALPFLAACNTVQGVGKDVRAVGNGITGASSYVQRNVFGSEPQPTQTTYIPAQPAVSVGQACDPNGELSGGEGLPPCRKVVFRER